MATVFTVQNNTTQKVVVNQRQYVSTITEIILPSNHDDSENEQNASLKSSFHKLSRLYAQECDVSPATLNIIAGNISKIM